MGEQVTTRPAKLPRAWRLAWVLLATALLGTLVWRIGHRPAEQPRVERNPGFLVDVNRANVDTLQLLPGLGPGIAANVVRHRETVGPFQSKAELEEVKMIGPVLRQRIEPWITIGPADTDPWSLEHFAK